MDAIKQGQVMAIIYHPTRAEVPGFLQTSVTGDK